MFPVQISRPDPDEFSRCEERGQMTDPGKGPSPIQRTDAALKASIYQAFSKDDVLRATEYHEIDVHAKNGIVYLNGHILGTTSHSRVKSALRGIPGILELRDNLVLDDKLTLEIATALGKLEHTYSCKFFTGVSHGVVSLNGIVSNENVKLLAEKCAADNPYVRAVINHVRVSGAEPELQDQPFLQPSMGEIIYFQDGVSGVVKQVIINPNNRRVIAMVIWGRFVDKLQELKSLNNGEDRPPEQLVVIPLDVVRYMTSTSAFLHISSNERKSYTDFDPAAFGTPDVNWTPPYPYCPDDVLFPVEYQNTAIPVATESQAPTIAAALKKVAFLGEPLIANDSLGG